MKSLFLFVLILFLLQLSLSAEDRIAGTLNNVDLFKTDLFNEDGHNIGENYFALNRNEAPMRIAIKLASAQNAEDHLIQHIIVLSPHQKADLGYITQQDLNKAANWKYEWDVRKDTL